MGIVIIPTYGADPATVNAANLDAKVAGLGTEFNGGIDNDNIDAAAAIANSKLNLASIAQNVSFAGTVGLTGVNTISGVTTMSSKIFKLAKGADVASVAGAITLGEDGNYFDITGTNAITSITAKTAGTVVVLQFDSTASLVDGSNLKLAGNFTGAAESQIMLSSDGTNWFEVSRSPNSYTPSVSNALSKSVIQIVNTQTGAVATGTTAVPDDDTIPTITEGDQYMTLAITPSNSSNTLKIDVVFFGSVNSADRMIVSLFQDATSAALATGFNYSATSNEQRNVNFSYYMTAGTTISTTFRVRGGQVGANTLTFNGTNGSRKFGGVMASSITITEYKA